MSALAASPLAAQDLPVIASRGFGGWEERPLSLTLDHASLPPLDVLMPRVEQRPVPPLLIQVRAFQFKGNTRVKEAELQKVVAPFTGRALTAEELEEARLAVTAAYVQRGFVNSGAILEDQDPDDSVITLTIVEGKLTEIQIDGNRWLRSRYISRRIERRAGSPLDVHGIQEALLLLNDHPLIEKVNSDLQPGGKPGESRLVVHVKERSPFHLGLEASNDRPASVGAEHLDLVGSDQSLTLNGDVLDFRLGLLNRTKNGADAGYNNFAISYALPLSSWDTTVRFAYTQNDYAIIEAPFDALDIDGRSNSFDVSLRQPLYRTVSSEFALVLTGSRRHSDTFLRGQRFSLSPGAVDGKTDVTVLRFAQEWLHRTQSEVVALRSSFHFGLDALGATKNGTDRDGRFFAWVGQAQYIRRLGQRGVQVILRVDGQWTPDQLLSLEQFNIGGINTVRGYRENQIVRDRGVVGSAELRVPLWSNVRGKPVLQLAAFYDVGAGWDVDEPTPTPKSISSLGGGVIFTPTSTITAEFYWAYRLREIEGSSNDNLQDQGINFRVTVLAF